MKTKFILFIAIGFVFIIGGMFSLQDNHTEDIYEKDCKYYKQPTITQTQSVDSALNQFENSKYFRGYKLNDYAECK